MELEEQLQLDRSPADWIRPGEGVARYLTERARVVLSDGVTADRVRDLISFAESLSTKAHPLTKSDATRLIAEIAKENAHA